MWFQKISIPPDGRDLPYDPSTPPEIPNLASYIALNFWLFKTPPPPRNFQSLLWGEYGYFLEPHIITFFMFPRYRNMREILRELDKASKGNTFLSVDCIPRAVAALGERPRESPPLPPPPPPFIGISRVPPLS